jgi:hypothetical protein
MAAFRLGPLSSLGQSKEAIDRPELVYNLFAQELRLADREILAVALLDTRFRLINKEQISVGILNEALAHPREILKPAIVHSAHSFALVHNHPSGDPTPSDADMRLTRQIKEAANVLRIHFLDHVIVGQPAPGQTGYLFLLQRSGNHLMNTAKALFSELVYDFQSERWNEVELSKLSLRELQVLAKLLGCPSYGTKETLVVRLLAQRELRFKLACFTDNPASWQVPIGANPCAICAKDRPQQLMFRF